MKTKLDTIGSPDDLKKMPAEDLDGLCQEIREMLISTAHENGGHLASNLGVVELTVALHRIFSSPRDKIIWDVGHQCYTHKLITGRKKSFSTIRQFGGLSGFPDPNESCHDPLYSGHAGTSVSSAVGIATAKNLQKSPDRVIAVIGDGSLGSGIALEAINHAGHAGIDLTIILNDNGMSISPTVGSLCRTLQKIRLDHRYRTARETFNKKVALLPFGARVLALSNGLKRIFKNTVLPGTLWEEMGFQYIGPVDGHNLRELEEILTGRRDAHTGPAIIHVITRKGKGYSPAESNAVKFHGISPSSGKKTPDSKDIQKEKSYSQVFAGALTDIMKKNSRVVAITAAMIDGTGLASVAERFPGRVFDVGICEQHAVTMAAGLASQGFIPVVAIYSTFFQRSYDQIIHDVCLQGLPVIFAIDRAGIVGDDGKTHQGIFDISFLRCVPGLTIAAPRDGEELCRMLGTAVSSRRPFAIRYPRGNTDSAINPYRSPALPSGRGEILRMGNDCAILSIGSMVNPSLAAAEQLKNSGIDCAVANMRYIKPVDRELVLRLAESTGTLITVEENVAAGGFGSTVLEILNEERITNVLLHRIAIPDEFIEHGTQGLLRSKLGLDASGIARQVWSIYSDMHREKVKQRVGV